METTLYNKNGQSYNTETGTKGTFDVSSMPRFGIPKDFTPSNPVNAPQIGNVPLAKLQTPTTPSYGGLEGELNAVVDFAKTQKEANLKAMENRTDTSLADYLKDVVGAGSLSSSVDRSAEDNAGKELDEYTSQLEQEQLANRRQIEALQKNNPQGLFGGGLEQEVNRITRDSLSKQADIAILQAGAGRRYDRAKSIADRQVEMKMEQSKALIEAKKFYYEQNKADFTKAEERMYQEHIKEEEKKVKKEEDRLTRGNEMILNAIQGKAPSSVVTKAMKILSEGGDVNSVASSLGNYSLSIGDRLENQIKQAQLNKLNTELVEKNPDAGELVKIGGKEYIRYKDGTISEPVLPEAKDTNMVVSRLDNKIGEIDRLTQNNGGVGLATSAGSLRGAPIPFLFKGKINDWRANIKNLTQKLTVDELGRVKSDGVTFGQLSNGERLAVGEAATALNAAMITTGKGEDKKATGKFKMSEKEVLRQLNTIREAYLLDFERRVGIPYSTYKSNPDAIKQKIADSLIDESSKTLETNLYGNYPIN